MSKRTSVSTRSARLPAISLLQNYQELQRLRKAVQLAEHPPKRITERPHAGVTAKDAAQLFGRATVRHV